MNVDLKKVTLSEEDIKKIVSIGKFETIKALKELYKIDQKSYKRLFIECDIKDLTLQHIDIMQFNRVSPQVRRGFRLVINIIDLEYEKSYILILK